MKNREPFFELSGFVEPPVLTNSELGLSCFKFESVSVFADYCTVETNASSDIFSKRLGSTSLKSTVTSNSLV